MASSHQPKDFDVFLSFRGEDTGRGFVSHLYKALDQHCIRTFIDDNLHRGENVPEELLEVIENSSTSIIVFSKNYASSSWCLDELAKIIECTKKVLPVFYQVDPSEVRKQKGDFGKALTKLEKKIKDKTKVQRWRDALTNAASISGWVYNDKDSCTESELVQKIVEEILNSEFIKMPSNVATMQLVGIDSHIDAVTKLLDIESNDVRMVGITGLGGIGKTAIAKAIYNRFSNHFKAKSFVENVREWLKTEQGKIHLQETLLKDIFEDKNLSVDTIYEGSTMINKILHLKKVLIILDDVDNADQIETLLGQCEGFAFQSRIILTTRNKSLLANQNGLSTYGYEVKELDEYEAIELFRMHAFPSNKVPEDYLELEKKAISYAKGLPLALEVMGRDLRGKTIDEWVEVLDSYKTNPLKDIQNVLKRSFEGLTENERNIFLDIACFFKGYDMSYNMIKDVLKACGLNPVPGIQNLIDKCLLTIDQNNYLSMHDLLQQMGMHIVRQEAQKPGERSRLWCYEEALDVVTENMGSDKIQSMILWPPKSEPVEVQIKAQFCEMKNLRLLLIRNVRCCNGPLECLPNGLSLLDWREYPFSSWPPKFFPKKLVVLNMPFILLKEPVLKQILVSLTYVDFSGCDLIRKIPDLMTPNIKSLIHSWCTNLVEIDDSVGRLDKLEVWDLYSCKNLETLPNCLTMKSLTYFNLEACERIKKFPNILHEMKGVEYLHLQGNCTNKLPLSFGNLIGLKGLSISSNSGEAHLPGSIYNLQHIEWLDFSGNVIFPKNVEIDRQPMCNSLGCSSKYVFPMLKRLQLTYFEIRSEIEFILNYCCPPTLEELEIYHSKVVTLPESMSRCERLHTLIIRDCDEFQEIPGLPHGIRHVEVASCHSLDLQSFFQLLPEIIGFPPNLPPCLGVTSNMLMFPHSSTMLPIRQKRLCEYSFEVTGDENDIPNWFNHQRDGNSISFSIGPEFPTIALCVAFGIQDSHCSIDYHVIVSINGSERMFERNFIEKDWSFRHLSFSSRPQSSLQELFRDLQLTDRNHVEILCETFHIFQEIAPIVERIGVHVECNCPPQNPSIFQDISRHLSLQSGQVLSSPEISETEESGECEEETVADIETTLKAEGITPEQDESNEEDPSPSLFSVEKCLLTLTQGAGESSLSTSQDPVECSLPMSQTPNSRNEADVLTNTLSNQDGVQDLSFESIKVSEISELMDFPSRVHSLKIEECDDLEFIPQGEVPTSLIKKLKEISETEERGECEDETDADIETTLKAKVITPEQDESNKEDPSSLFLEEKSSLPPTQGAGESSLPMSQTPNSRNEADVLTITWSNQDGVQDMYFESIKVSEISELMDLPTWVHSLRIEGCDDLEFIPKEVMSSELSLQDLYIINCCSLKSFPKDHPPTALKILYIRNCKKLNFPLTTEKKTHQDALLEYLCIGSSCDSLKSISLDLFPNLKSLSIWDCANLELLSMPVQKNLTSLEALEIRDCPNLVSFLGGGLHTMNLTSVWLSNCKKLEKLPELHTLDSLQSMFINNCPELVSLSEKGLPSRLSLLSITFCNKLKFKDEWGLDGLDYLRRLEIEGGCVDVGSFPEKFLPSNLSSLRISGLLNLKNLDNKGFQQLTALQRLEISCCPNLQSFPEDGFPSSLSFLCIKECPLLTSKFRNKKGKDWSKIDHISCIEIDEEVIS